MLIAKALDPAFWQAVRTEPTYAHIVAYIEKIYRESRWDAIPGPAGIPRC